MRKKGVEYPGETEISLELSPGSSICSDVTVSDTNCTVAVPRGVYDITLTQSNEVGSTVDHLHMIDSKQFGFVCSIKLQGLP